MGPRWLLSLLCLSLVVLCLVPLTRAGGDVRVNEANTRILFEKDPAEVLLAIDNSSGERVNAKIHIDLIDPKSHSKAEITRVQSIEAGSQTLRLSLPVSFSKLNETERKQLLWYRLSYHLSKQDASDDTLTEGIISLSEITPDLFDIRIATSEIAREGGRYPARVHASHPITRRPAANVRVDGEFTLDDDKTIKLQAAKTTDSKGYALFDFTLPPRLPQSSRSGSGEFRVTATRGGVVANAKGEIMVDQAARILINSDKPLYQPGQVMHLRALAFNPSMRALANQNILFRITDPEDATILNTMAKSSRFGVANVEWPIPENTRLGDYRVWVGVEGSERHSQSVYNVRISRYELPNFTVSVEPDRKFYLPGQNAEVKVRADYLFGQPVPRGRVRVVRETRREWNYREQKWDIDEGDKYEGETDSKGFFVARINLEEDHEDLSTNYYQRFSDVTYAAYFTDPTTNRTEQRRFDLRVTKEAIHVYVLRDAYDWSYSRSVPLRFYISTFYADGSPARCKVNVSLNSNNDSRTKKAISKSLAPMRTNRYGLVKVNGVRLPPGLEDEAEVDLVVSAAGSRGAKGSKTEDVSLDDGPKVIVETDKALYRTGEPITAFITSSGPDQTVTVEIARDLSVIRSERAQLRNGRTSVTFPYTPELKGQLTIAAYHDFEEWERGVGTRTVLYPRDPELNVKVRTSRASYRPGEDAHVNLSVRRPEGGPAESALGVVVLDRAVEERFRTDQEFGNRSSSLNSTLEAFLGAQEQLAGVTFRDLQRLDMSKPVSPELDLLAEILLNRDRDYYPRFHGGNQYEQKLEEVFGEVIGTQLYPIRETLASHYVRTQEYPKNEGDLRRLLSQAQIDLNTVRDPWDIPFRAVFSVDKQFDVLTLVSAGADKRFDTNDDLAARQQSWPYFRSTGEAIDKAVRRYHERTGGFIRDFATLSAEVAMEGLTLDQIRDRWGQPYRFSFDVEASNYVIKIGTGGPDKQFSIPAYINDDFVIWRTVIDYFEKPRAQIDLALTQYLNSTKKFPHNDGDLREALPNFGDLIEANRDPWNRPYYRTYRTESTYADRVRVENRAQFGSPVTQTEVVPVTRVVASISMRSAGPDGQPGTQDDFTVGTFSGVISDQERGKPARQPGPAGLVLSGANGAIYGVVIDSSGAVIPGVTVTARQPPDGQSYTGTTNDEGQYSIDLPGGLYEVRFHATGFMATVLMNVVVRPSNLTEVNATLRPGAVAETVTVTDGGAAIQTESSSVAKSVNAARSTASNLYLIAKLGGRPQISTPRLREYFPETLLWQPSIETDKHGRAQINFKLADNITTWKMAVIGSTEDGRIGTAETEIKAFQPFFVEHDPPRVLTEGDEISLPVVVRNYLERIQKVDLEIKPETWFALLGPARKQTSVAAGDATRETFDLKAIASVKDGKQRITAGGSDESDAIEKPVTVHPDGEEQSITAGDILSDSSSLELHIPENTIPNSKRGEIKLFPNLMAHVIESVEGIMQRPYGCAEQTISSTYPSLLLLRHHKQSGEDFALRTRAERYLNDGYSRLLNYRHESGGFAYWTHGRPDVALTAYAVRFLTDAGEVISVDENVIKGAREWLTKQQQTDGSWEAPSWGAVARNDYRHAVLTAYIAGVLSRGAPSDALKRALNYLGQQGITIDEPYLLASYALAAMNAGDQSRATPVIEKLRSLALSEGTGTYWELETNTPFYGWGLAGRVETTAIVVQALDRYCDSKKCGTERELIQRGLLFLLRRKDRYGVWYSTQATINVLDALLMQFSKRSVNSGAQSAAEIFVNGRAVQTLQLPAADRLSTPMTVDISEFLHTGKNVVQIKRPTGSSLSSVQAVVNYYVPWPAARVANHSDNLRLVAKFDKTEGKINEEITCNVEVERIGFRGFGMMLAEIGVPPGAEVDRSSLETAMKSSGWAISQYDVLPDRVVFYLWPQGGGVKFDFKFRPRFGLNAKTASSVVYDYYNPEARAVVPPAIFKIK